MEFIEWVETRLAGKRLEIHEVAKMDRVATGTGAEELGLTLADGKTVLKQVQQRIVQNQIEVISAAAKPCQHCGRNQRIKDLRTRQLRTVFGVVEVNCHRFVRCTCRGGKPRAHWPLRWMGAKRTMPELSYLFCEMGQHHAVSTGGSTAKRVSAVVERQDFSGDGPAPHARGRPGARAACDRARRIRLARFAPSGCAVR